VEPSDRGFVSTAMVDFSAQSARASVAAMSDDYFDFW
jgi:hypothetical protein